MSTPLLEVNNLVVRFPIWGGVLRHKVAEVRAVDLVLQLVALGERDELVAKRRSDQLAERVPAPSHGALRRLVGPATAARFIARRLVPIGRLRRLDLAELHERKRVEVA